MHLLLHLLAGAALVLLAITADPILGQASRFGALQATALGTGVVLAGAGLLDRGRFSRFTADACLVVLAVLGALALAEVTFRAAGFDFNAGRTRAMRAVPPFYRQPTVPLGEGFFRRPGPERWRGPVLFTRLRQLGVHPNPYGGEPSIDVVYDRQGFRNEESLTDWEIAVAGDSFTEMGYLPQRQLFTSLLATALRTRVKNLGASYTGPLTQLAYLRVYGLAPGTRTFVVVFFEGNDLKNLAAEQAALARVKASGRRDLREIPPQPSPVRALATALARARPGLELPPSRLNYVQAHFRSSRGHVPVTLVYTPPGRAEVTDETREAMEGFLRDYAALAVQRGAAAWLAYMPCKERVLHPWLEFAPSTPAALRSWRPTDLPELVREMSARHGVTFLDLTPALAEETGHTGELLYNGVYDSHLNARGSGVVADALAAHLRPRRRKPRHLHSSACASLRRRHSRVTSPCPGESTSARRNSPPAAVAMEPAMDASRARARA